MEFCLQSYVFASHNTLMMIVYRGSRFIPYFTIRTVGIRDDGTVVLFDPADLAIDRPGDQVDTVAV
ncbi:MAG: hypothetical protein EOP48_34220 [Sphingobacteriales bacterium]|nr:MAG: hypothetical protein EOP48_34220 [Sphingobacteriales bacterium]